MRAGTDPKFRNEVKKPLVLTCETEWRTDDGMRITHQCPKLKLYFIHSFNPNRLQEFSQFPESVNKECHLYRYIADEVTTNKVLYIHY